MASENSLTTNTNLNETNSTIDPAQENQHDSDPCTAEIMEACDNLRGIGARFTTITGGLFRDTEAVSTSSHSIRTAVNRVHRRGVSVVDAVNAIAVATETLVRVVTNERSTREEIVDAAMELRQQTNNGMNVANQVYDAVDQVHSKVYGQQADLDSLRHRAELLRTCMETVRQSLNWFHVIDERMRNGN